MMNLTYIHFDNFIKVSKNHKSLKIVKISTFWLPQVAALHTTIYIRTLSNASTLMDKDETHCIIFRTARDTSTA